MLRTFDRDEVHKVEFKDYPGVIVSVKMFDHTQEANYSRFVTAPYLSGAVAKIEDAVQMTASASVAWASESDVDQFVKMIADCVTDFEGIDITNVGRTPGEDASNKDVLKALPFSFVMQLGKKIEGLSTLTPAQEQD